MTNLTLENHASEREIEEKKRVCGGDFSSCFSRIESNQVSSIALEMKVKEGLEFMLSHFSGPLFPRKVSTAATRGKQYEMPDKDTTLYYYKAALYENCRIEAFGVSQTNPDLIFIELDLRDFGSMKNLKTRLTMILKRIEETVQGHPTVYWSGRGYHIVQPIDCPLPLEDVNKEFTALSNDPNTDFIRFAESYLSGNKQDKSHNPSMRSCLLRIPHTLNSKCKEAGIDAEVKIIQKWDGYRPEYKLLIGSFYAYLVGEREKERSRYQDAAAAAKNYALGVDYGPIGWIEKLLQTPIDDFRKRSSDLILVPYLVVRRGMTDVDQIHNVVMQWADKCGELYRLEPTRREYSNRVRSRIYEVMQSNPRIPNMSLENLKEKNPELYRQLYVPIK